MNKNKKIILSISLAASMAINAMANENESLGEISVTDTAFESQVKSITSSRLEKLQANDVKDILKSLPSVIVDGSARYSQKVYVRGLEDKSSNITIDGAKMSGQLFHHSGDQTIDAEMLKIGSIELGPNSALSGAGVINGSFIYETKDPSDFLEEGETFGGKISAGYESGYERKKTSVAVFSKLNDKIEFVGIGNITEDGELHTPASSTITSKESKLKSGLLKVVYKPNEYNTIKLAYNTYNDGGDRQLSGEKPGNDETNPHNEITRDTYTLNYTYAPDNDLVKIEAKAYSNTQKLVRDSLTEDYSTNGEVDGDLIQPERTYENKVVGFDLRNSSILSNHLITYGVDYSKEEQSKSADGLAVYSTGSRAGETEVSSVVGKGEIEAYGLYIEDEIDLDKLVLNIGARYDVHELGGFYSGKFEQLSPKFKAAYQATNKLKLRAAYGRIFKGPSLGETLMLNDNIVQSDDTQPQTGNNYEIGFDYDLAYALNADNSIFGFTAFTYNVDNYLHPTKNSSIEAQSDMKIWGLETVFKYQKDKFGLNASHTYTDGEDKSLEDGSVIDPRTAKIHTFKVGLDYQATANLFLNYSGEFVPGNKYQYKVDEKVKRSGYAVHNVSASYDITAIKGAKVSFGIDNILDKKFTRHTAFGTYFGDEGYTAYEVGRNFKVNLSYKF